ncbi:DUF4468 domain-containing protein [Runella sp.]|uniref:DUF4468 domain-containing protein n=1 Tax=Runella sp. TaxID=1960881 RepID=UPI003D0E9B83
MKRLLFMLLGMLAITVGYSQELRVDPVANTISYEEIVPADSLSAITILKLTKKWAVTVFGAGKDMIDYYDEADSTMIIKPVIKITTKLSMPVGYAVKEVVNQYNFHYKLEIETKKGRYRIYANDFNGESKGPNGEKFTVESIFYDEGKAIAGQAKLKEMVPKNAQKYLPNLRLEDMKQEKLDLQNELDRNVRDSFESLKKYIRSRPKKDW